MKNYKLALLIIYLCGMFSFSMKEGYDNTERIGITSKGERVDPIPVSFEEAALKGRTRYYLSKDGEKQYDVEEKSIYVFVWKDFFLAFTQGFTLLFGVVFFAYIFASIKKRRDRKRGSIKD